jgi:hypothetical protein
MSYGDTQRYWLACAYGTSPDTCQHDPKCVELTTECHRGDTPPYGNYWRSRMMGPSLDPAEPALTVAAALAAYDGRPCTGPGTGLSAVIQPNELAAYERVLAAARAEQAARCEDCGAPLRAGQGDGNSCGPCTVLEGVKDAQGDPGKFGLGPAHELAALRDLADAVREAQHRR